MLLAGALLVGCATPLTLGSPGPSGSPSVSSSGGPLRYVALGDSYTIGTSVGESERWPNQLVAALHGTVELELVANLGVNGYATDDLLLDEMPRLASLAPDFVTLLIGVNDVVRGVPAERYAANVRQILDGLLAQLPADRIVVVSTPDYTRTPRGGDFGDSVQQRAAIAEFNAIIAAEAGARAISFVDIGPVADRADQDPSLVARDELHPSGGQYAGWVELIAPVVSGLIADDA
jgi:lysophospholipase L1-like esterase